MIKSTVYRLSRFLPMIGIFIYVALYFIAAKLYPGGSRVYPDKDGFDWYNNYWCHLISENAINGEANTAHPYAHVGMVVLGISLAVFFYQFPQYFKIKQPWKSIVRISGIAGSFFSMLIMSDYHDLTAVLAAVFGALSIVGIFFGLRNTGLLYFIWTGIGCVLLIALNGYIYFSGNYILWLPVIQKITFAAVLLWVVFLNSMFAKGKNLVSIKKSFYRVLGYGRRGR